jgi:hypothetical protein
LIFNVCCVPSSTDIETQKPFGGIIVVYFLSLKLKKTEAKNNSNVEIFHNEVIKLKAQTYFRAKIPNKKFYSLDF